MTVGNYEKLLHYSFPNQQQNIMTSILTEAFIYLFAAVVAVPISKQLGLGSVLGYLIAGSLLLGLFFITATATVSLEWQMPMTPIATALWQ